jgi:hypothetical protein
VTRSINSSRSRGTSGEVFAFDVHGGDASIAPSGSVVDLAVYP